MAAAELPTHLLQLPRDVLLSVVERCGPREKWALFLTCHFGRGLVLDVAQQISGSLQISLYFPRKRRPPLLMRDPDGCWLDSVHLQLKDVSLSSLLHCGDQLHGIKHLKLAMVETDDILRSLRAPLHWLSPWLAPSSPHRLQRPLSQLCSLSITEIENTDAPGLLGALATSCTQLTHLELHTGPWLLSSIRHNQGLRGALDQLSSVGAFPALQSLSVGCGTCGSRAGSAKPYDVVRALELLTNHPAAQRRVTRLVVPQVLPANLAVRLANLRELHVEQAVSVSQVQALQCLSCLTSLTVMGLAAQLNGPVFQLSDPPRLQVFRMQILPLYTLDGWMPLLVNIPHLQVGSLSTYDGSERVVYVHQDSLPTQRSQVSASKDAAAALMHGRHLAGVESGLRSYQWGSQERDPPVVLDWSMWRPALQGQALDAVQPLLSQLPFNDWLELLDALPGVGTVQITFRPRKGYHAYLQGAFPVYRVDGMYSSLEPAVERVMDCAISACEQKGRTLELCGPKGWLTFEEYQGLVNRSHVIRVAEIY